MIDFRCIGLPVCRKQKRTDLSTITFFSPTFPMFCNHNFATTLTKASLSRMIKCYFIFMSVANCFNIIFPVSTLLKMNTWPTIPAFQSPDLQYLQQLKTIKTWTIYSHKKKKKKITMYIPILVINLYLLYILNIVHLLYVQNYQYHVYFYVTHSKSSLLAEILAETEKIQ